MKLLFLVGLAVASLCTVVPAGAINIELNPPVAKQGQTLQVLVHDLNSAAVDGVADGAAPPVVHFRNKDYRIFPLNNVGGGQGELQKADNGRALIGIPATLAPGTYNLKVGDIEKQVKVVAGTFGVQSIRLPKGKDTFQSSPGEEEAVDAAKASLNPHQFWDGKFLRPSKARVSSGFGLRRRVNGVLLKDYFHSGLDFAGGTGNPVTACQAGKVIIAHHGWRLHGNTICIDHGQGVVSFYIHLSKVFVKEGDFVKAGQKIGAIGSTGRANGPHLHFSLYVNKDATNPWDWFSKQF